MKTNTLERIFWVFKIIGVVLGVVISGIGLYTAWVQLTDLLAVRRKKKEEELEKEAEDKWRKFEDDWDNVMGNYDWE